MKTFDAAVDTRFKQVERELLMAFQSPILHAETVIQYIKPVGWSRVSFTLNGVPMCVTHEQALVMAVQNNYMNYLAVLSWMLGGKDA